MSVYPLFGNTITITPENILNYILYYKRYNFINVVWVDRSLRLCLQGHVYRLHKPVIMIVIDWIMICYDAVWKEI